MQEFQLHFPSRKIRNLLLCCLSTDRRVRLLFFIRSFGKRIAESRTSLQNPNMCSLKGYSQSEVLELKLLLDEMYAGLKEYFEALSYEVLTAQEVGLRGAKDRDVVEYAGKNDLLLITQD